MTSLFPSTVISSSFIVGQTSKSWKVSNIFIGKFTEGSDLATRVGSKKYSLIPKEDFNFLYGSRLSGDSRQNGFPVILDEFQDKDSNCLYARDWQKLKTWRVF